MVSFSCTLHAGERERGRKRRAPPWRPQGSPLHLTGLQLAQLHVDGHLLASPVDLHGDCLARIFAEQGIPSLSEEALGEGRN